MAKIYQNDIGTRVRTTLTGETITGFTQIEYRWRKPDLEEVVFNVAAGLNVESEGPPAIVFYDSKTGDFNLCGFYKIQVFFVAADGDSFLSETREFEVFAKFK